MAAWYIKRGEKVAGPVDAAKLKQLVSAGKVLPSDALAKEANGPWTPAGRTSLFASSPKPASVPTAVANEPDSAPIVPTVERLPIHHNGNGKRTGVLEAVGRGTLAVGGGVFRVLSVRSQRRHELKLAKAQAKATAPVQQQAAQVPIQVAQVPAPAIQITNVNTNVVNVGGSVKRWSRLVAFLLSFFIPGLGQMYKGQVVNGVVWFVLVIVGYVCFIVPGIVLHMLCAIGAAMGNPYR
jgi:TM2 domain-containing membrane protein YozV